MKIGVVDSGVGGITVLKRLINKYPNNEYFYYGDTKHLPYGDKSIQELKKYFDDIISFFKNKKVELVIIACGTLSSNIDYLNKDLPLIDIVSILNNKLDNYNEVCVIATSLSIKTNAYKKYIHTKLDLRECPKLVPIIESRDYTYLDDVLKEYLSNINSDCLLLGCTHYKIIIDYIKKYYHKKIYTLDDFLSLDNIKDSKKDLEIYFSKLNSDIIDNVRDILKINDLKILEVKND